MIQIDGTANQDRPRRRRHPLRRHWLALTLTIGLALLAAWFTPGYWALNDIDKVITRAEIRTATVKRGDLVKDIVSDGQIVAANSPTLFSLESGLVKLHVNAGEEVSKGQRLASITNDDLTEELAKAQAKIQELQMTFKREEINNKRRLAEAMQKQELSHIELSAMEREFQRAKKAFSLSLISDEIYSAKQDQLLKAEVYEQQAQKNVVLIENELAFYQQNFQLILKQQQLTIDTIARRVARLDIQSPVTGMVGKLDIRDSEVVEKNQPIMTVVDLQTLEVEAQVPELYASDLAQHQRVDIKVKDQLMEGEIYTVSPEVVEAKVTVRIRFLQGNQQRLRQNQRVTTRIYTQEIHDVLYLERGNRLDNFYGSLFKVSGDKALSVPVNLGTKTMNYVVIENGLYEDDEVIISMVNTDREIKSLLLE